MPVITRTAILIAKLLGLTLVLLITSALGSTLLPAPEAGGAEAAAPAAPGGSFLALVFGLLFLQALALAVPILRSRWGGWRLTATIAVVYFGTVTFLSQIESLVYLGDKMPPGMQGGLFLMGLINALVFAPMAVLVLGRWRGDPEAASRPWPWPRRVWGRVAIGGLVMLALYYLFGYYVAWQEAAVREFYGGTDPGSFFAQIASVAQGAPWMLPFQYLRGVLWTLIALLVLRSMRGPWWQAGFALALLFTVPALYLLLPNPLMPDAVRMAHLIETAPYQFLFGWFAAWLLCDRRRGLVAIASETPGTRKGDREGSSRAAGTNAVEHGLS